MKKKVFSGKYEIKQEIGRGGMGIIYEALHTALNRTVAIKVLHPQFTGDPTFLKRFQREARAMARLDHENIIRVFDVAEDEGSYYIVMEYFSGKDLKQIIIEKGSLSKTESLAITLQMAKALSYAHTRGIIHRDIKPSNIMVNDAGIVKIADFGIAAATDEISVTATGNIIGTPEYMSGEQARGEQLDGRNDLYSLGMVLYEMLTSHTSYAGVSGRAILGKILYDKEEFDLSFQSNIPLPLRDLVRNLLKKNREDRVPDAATLIEDISKVLSELGEDPEPSEILEEADLAETLMFNPDESSDTAILQKSPSAIKESEVPSFDSSSVKETLEEASSHVVPEKIQASRTKKASPSRMTTTNTSILFISLASLVVIILIAMIYMLPSTEDKEVPPSSSLPLPAVPSLVDDISEIQGAILEIQSELVRSQREADTPNVHRWAKELYDEALDLKNKGSKILKEGNNFVEKEKYAVAKERLVSANSILTRAHEEFLKAEQTAGVRMVQEEKSRIEKEKQKQQQAKTELERLRQERIVAARERLKQEEIARIEKEKLLQEEAKTKKEKLAQEKTKAARKRLTQERIIAERERQKQEVIARIEREKLKQEKARIETERLNLQREKAEREKLVDKRTRPVTADIDLIGGILKRFKTAYEKKDLRSLQKMSNMSMERSRFLVQIFQNYKTIRVSITDLSLTGDAALAIISITALTSQDGSRVLPSNRWKAAKLTIRKDEGRWGKVIW